MKIMKLCAISALLIIFSFSASANSEEMKNAFLQACASSPHVEEGSNCNCVFNEVVHQFGENDAKELIPFIRGDKEIDTEISAALTFISGKCEG